MTQSKQTLHFRGAAAVSVAREATDQPVLAAHQTDLEQRQARFRDACSRVEQCTAHEKATREVARASLKRLECSSACVYQAIKVNAPKYLPETGVTEHRSPLKLLIYAQNLVVRLERQEGAGWTSFHVTVLNREMEDAGQAHHAARDAKTDLGNAHKELAEASRSLQVLLTGFMNCVRVTYGADSEQYRMVKSPQRRKPKATPAAASVEVAEQKSGGASCDG